MSEKPDPRYFDEQGNYLDGPHYGQDCPVGKVQVEFVGVDPKLRFSEYGWKPTDRAFIEVWVDGRRFRIDIGTFHDGRAERRGLHIVMDSSVVVERTAVNAASLFFGQEQP